MKKEYIIFHKPWGVLSQFTSDETHRNLSEFNFPKDIYPAGRLDKDSEGLLLLTNDGPFIDLFLKAHPRKYWAQVEGIPTNEDIKKLGQGILLNDGPTLPCEISILDSQIMVPPRMPPIRERKSIPTTWIELILKEGRNRQVRRMTAAIGFPTLRLLRVGLGNFEPDLFHDLKVGEWRRINKNQII
jgi:23S rRNA pseudouridine2457 synthase